jgi:hypothetical protein
MTIEIMQHPILQRLAPIANRQIEIANSQAKQNS